MFSWQPHLVRFRLIYNGTDLWKGRWQELCTGPQFTVFYILSDHFGFDLDMVSMIPGFWNPQESKWMGVTDAVKDGDFDIGVVATSAVVYNFQDAVLATNVSFHSHNFMMIEHSLVGD